MFNSQDTILAGFLKFLKTVHEPEYLRSKFADHRLMYMRMQAIGACFGIVMWSWDYLTDAYGASATLSWRCAHVLLLLNVYCAYRQTRRLILEGMAIATAVLSVLLFIEILQRLNCDFSTGVGGFMYFMLMPLAIFQGISIGTTIALVLLCAALPHLSALLGGYENFQHIQYAILIWPATLMVGLCLWISELNYLSRYQTTLRLNQSNRELEIAHQSEKQRQSELSRFLAIASHDLRQPMHALNLYLSNLSQHALAPASQEVLHNALECTQAMDGMFVNLLDISRLDAEVVQADLTVFSLQNLFERLYSTFAPLAQNKNLQLEIYWTSLSLRSDANILEQILRNLIANAIRYTDQGKVELIAQANGNDLRLIIRDSGIGIDSQNHELIFSEFTQLNPNSLGLGLGLAIVRRLANLLHCQIELHSQPGVGSEFSLVLRDCLQSPAHPQSVVENHRTLPAGLHIILMDDDHHVLQATRFLLENWHCQVTASSNYQDLHPQLITLKQAPDLLIFDFRLPGNQSGLELLIQVRQYWSKVIPAILLTGDLTALSAEDLQQEKLILLHKPLLADKLKLAILSLIGA